MNRVLLVEASTNKEASVSRKAGKMLLERLKLKDEVQVKQHDLSEKPIPHINAHTIGSFYTKEESRTEEQRKAVALSDEFVNEVIDSDTIVITTPMWNFSVPSSLKAWIDHIVRVGKTFSFQNGVLKGHLEGKKVYAIVSAGDIYSSGPMQTSDYMTGYFKSVFGFVGITDVTVLWVEGTALPETKSHALEKFKLLLDQTL